ncbi:MAG: hypothetical protein KKC14_14815 [Alphaproteobacteria bacterium]|nr:hypothetical protein [Alphaproteobacteria bacterium]
MEVTGRIKLGESQYCQPAYYRRLIGWRSNGLVIWLVWMAAMALILSGVIARAGTALWTSLLVAVTIMMLVWIAFQKDVLVRAWRRRGALDDLVVRYAVEVEGLRISSNVVDSLLLWEGITDISPGQKRWLFMVHEGVYFLMINLFANESDEKAFLTACLDRVTPEAKSRSVEAVAYAGKAST